MVKGVNQWPVSEDEAFDLWLRLKDKGLRTLQRFIKRKHDKKIPLTVLASWRDRGNWVERGFKITMTLEAEVNRAAFETIQGRMVRRRAETMEYVSGIFDEVIRKAAGMVRDNGVFDRYYSGSMASPKVLLDSLSALERLGKLYQTLLPTTRHTEEGAEIEPEEALDGSIDPLRLANHLIVMATRPKLIDLTKEVEKETGSAAR